MRSRPATRTRAVTRTAWRRSARALALASGLTSPAAETVAQAGRLHDLGKIGVPESVLGKGGPLTDEEWAVMRLHPLTGAQILAPLEFFGEGMLIVRHHHERFDGSGYPDGLRGPAIPLGARIVAVADVYDALTSDRPYRGGCRIPWRWSGFSARRGARWTASWSCSSPIPTPMDLLTAPFDVDRRRRVAPVVGALCVAGSLMLAASWEASGWSVRAASVATLGLAVEGVAVHGGFIAQGLIITLAGPAGRRHHRPADGRGALRGLSPRSSRPWGSLAFLLIPPLLVHECRGHSTLRRIGFLAPVRPASLLVGLGVGAFLGAHLLVTSSLTFGYAISVVSVAAYTSAVAYDVGANALSAEWLFRGALFSHWWRHWGFWGAVTVSTAFTLVRYLLDPALPQAPEARAGAIVYLAALALGAAVLRAWSGSLVPGYLASVGLLRRLSGPRRVVAAALALLLAVTAGMVWEGGTPVSPLRHLYLVPVAWAALHGGARAGGLLGLMAGLFQVPLVLPAIERAGLTGAAVEGLVSLALPPAVGVLAGLLCDQSRARARRLAALLEIEQCLAREDPLPVRLDAVAAVVRRGLNVARVGVLVGTSAETPALGSAPPGARLTPGRRPPGRSRPAGPCGARISPRTAGSRSPARPRRRRCAASSCPWTRARGRSACSRSSGGARWPRAPTRPRPRSRCTWRWASRTRASPCASGASPRSWRTRWPPPRAGSARSTRRSRSSCPWCRTSSARR